MGDNSVEPDAVTGARERPKASSVRRVVVCTGQVYYKLHQLRKAKRADDVALVRLEQLSPFPHAALARRLAGRYPNAELVWCQEEPKNMGYWAFAQPRINTAVREILEVDRRNQSRGGVRRRRRRDDDGDDRNEVWAPNGRARRRRIDGTRRRIDGTRFGVRYVGRPAAASPATGSPVIHAAETRALVHEALGLEHVGIHLAEPRSSVPRY